MKKLLVLKHWQLFLVLFGIPFFLQIVLTSAVIATESPSMLFFTIPIIMVVYLGIFFLWLYTLGTQLHKKLPETVLMKINFFKMALVFPLVYLAIIIVGIYYMISNIVVDATPNFALLFLIIPLHLFSIFCMLFALYFIAKALKSVEIMKQARFNDFIGEFFLFWFFPIGIWFLQPRINKLFDENLPLDTDQALDSSLRE